MPGWMRRAVVGGLLAGGLYIVAQVLCVVSDWISVWIWGHADNYWHSVSTLMTTWLALALMALLEVDNGNAKTHD